MVISSNNYNSSVKSMQRIFSLVSNNSRAKAHLACQRIVVSVSSKRFVQLSWDEDRHTFIIVTVRLPEYLDNCVCGISVRTPESMGRLGAMCEMYRRMAVSHYEPVRFYAQYYNWWELLVPPKELTHNLDRLCFAISISDHFTNWGVIHGQPLQMPWRRGHLRNVWLGPLRPTLYFAQAVPHPKQTEILRSSLVKFAPWFEMRAEKTDCLGAMNAFYRMARVRRYFQRLATPFYAEPADSEWTEASSAIEDEIINVDDEVKVAFDEGQSTGYLDLWPRRAPLEVFDDLAEGCVSLRDVMRVDQVSLPKETHTSLALFTWF